MDTSTCNTALVIDDDHLIRWALSKELSGLGMTVLCGETAQNLLDGLAGRPCDVLFLDVNLPDGNGLDHLEKIRAISPDTKIVVLTADSRPDILKRALEGGAHQLIEKPFEISDIHRVLRSALGDYSPRREYSRYLCTVPLYLTIMGQTGIGETQPVMKEVSGFMADVSPGGFRLSTGYPLRVGQNLRAHVEVSDDPFLKFLPPDGLSEVVWVTPGAQSVTAGLRFVS